jgi:pilus assembly protein Flp/PilA
MLYHPPVEKGQGLMEYALILVLIAVVVVAVLVLFGPMLGNLYSSVYDLFPT